jgi:hypothetical protein
LYGSFRGEVYRESGFRAARFRYMQLIGTAEILQYRSEYGGTVFGYRELGRADTLNDQSDRLVFNVHVDQNIVPEGSEFLYGKQFEQVAPYSFMIVGVRG